MTTAFDNARDVALIHSGSEYFDYCCRLIDAAKHTIHLQTYIFESDRTGQRIKQHLIEAAARGVKVFLLLDGFGSKGIDNADVDEMKRGGITLRFFSPLNRTRPFRLGRRLHHKVLVTDEQYALVGGINISDAYSGFDGNKPWFDYALYIEGEVCIKLNKICLSLFNKKYIPTKLFFNQGKVKEELLIRFRQCDFIRGKQEITKSYKEFISNAKKEIVIVNAYFLPGLRMRRLMQKAVNRGVQISVLLSAKSDVPVVKRAMNYYYSWLFRNKIHVYEYRPTNVHAKVAVFDSELITLGSYNLNYLSEYISVELNVDVKYQQIASELSLEIQKIIQSDCVHSANNFYIHTNVFSRFLDFLSYQLIIYAMRFLFTLTEKERINILK